MSNIPLSTIVFYLHNMFKINITIISKVNIFCCCKDYKNGDVKGAKQRLDYFIPKKRSNGFFLTKYKDLKTKKIIEFMFALVH